MRGRAYTTGETTKKRQIPEETRKLELLMLMGLPTRQGGEELADAAISACGNEVSMPVSAEVLETALLGT